MTPSKDLLTGIGQRVRTLRQGRRLTMRALAASSGLSERFVSELEAGRANISVLNLAEVASALGVELVELFPDKSGRPMARLVSLLGLRGAGKSTVGQALAERMGVPFYELDRLVEREAGMGLAEIFAIHGEAYFRQLELGVLERFLNEHAEGVLATGGGLVTSPGAFELLLQKTRTVWLRAKPEEHWERVVGQGDLRPMQNRPQAMAELRRRLREREPLYRQASVLCSTSGRPVGAVVEDVYQRVGDGAPAQAR